MKTILLAEFDDERFADVVEKEVASRYGLVTKRLRADLPSVRTRGWQLNAEDLLSEVSRLRDEHRTDFALGFTHHDIYVPDMNFVFGIASHEGGSAIVAGQRLKSPQPGLFQQRLLKEVVHELGHVFGLVHCDDVRCVMHFSNSLTDTDVKDSRFCAKCSSKLDSL